MKPILFNIETVRAVSNGLKTVTRRVVKPQPKYQLRIHDEGYHKGEWHECSENPMADKWCNRPSSVLLFSCLLRSVFRCH